MKNVFYGTKKIAAEPMTRQEYNDYRGWKLPSDEDGSDAGYLVEYLDGGTSNHPDHKGYISWSPAPQFDAAYQPTTAMSFGHAIQAMEEGHKVTRAGWNGKCMWVALTTGCIFDARDAKDYHSIRHLVDELQADLPHDGTENLIEIMPHIDVRTADGSMVIGWLASQSDMLAKDWQIV